jgi:hypothetical protein
MAVLIPTVHLNGSHAEGLREEAHRAMCAIGDAISAVGDMGPDARDYYPQGPNVASVARRDHDGRIARLRSVLEEISAIYDGIDDQITARDARRQGR